MGGDTITPEQVEKNAQALIESHGNAPTDEEVAVDAKNAVTNDDTIGGAVAGDTETVPDDPMDRSAIAGEPEEGSETTGEPKPTATDTEQKPEWDKDRQKLQQELANERKKREELEAQIATEQSTATDDDEGEIDPTGLSADEAAAIAAEFPDDVDFDKLTALDEEFTDEELREQLNRSIAINKAFLASIHKGKANVKARTAEASARDTAIEIVGEELRNDLLAAIATEKKERGLDKAPLPPEQLKDMYAAIAYRVKSEALQKPADEKHATTTPKPGSERSGVVTGATEEASDTKFHGIELDLKKLG
ncbi:MAG TPA: hypothetical protein VMW52_12020 [Phycisphaerae bacterium]|nr:hypothetical protein [Phycisphaerae bacterium]